MRAFPLLALAIASALPGLAWQNVNPHSEIQQAFNNSVQDYMKVHKAAAAKFPAKSSDSQEAIVSRSNALADAIRAARPQAAQGQIFTPPVAAEFRRLFQIAMQGKNGRRIRQSMRSAEPVHLQLKVDDRYPENVPLQSTPPTLLMSLPRLPAGLEYRMIGPDLLLCDADANLILDFARNVVPK